MKKNYFKLLALALFAFTIKANAQCTSCTTTITGADAANHIVSAGTTLCISATGTATGLITVSNGGILCNQGTINSTDLWVAGGTFNNYGTVNTNRLLVSVQGVYNNYASGTATLDSILITNIYSALNNSGAITAIRMGNSDNSSITNNGFITVDFLGDSAAQFNNNANSSLKINFDLYNAYNSGFFNAGFVDVDRDWLNSTGATFETDCMIAVGRDWYNVTPATVKGPPTGSCGGFTITGVSANSGTIGSAITHIDLCDLGNPALGIDGPAGTIATTTTYCTCTNVCTPPVGINEQMAQSAVLIQNIYPNPAINNLTVELENKENEQLLFEVYDMMGRKHSSLSINSMSGLTKTIVDVSKLAQGTYILSITDSKNLQSKSLFNVVK